MINAPADFPEAGSYALIRVDGRMAAVRVIRHAGEGDARSVDVSLLGVPAASGRRRVAFADLYDGTPLTPAERCELAALQAKRRYRDGERQRLAILTSRDVVAPVLAAARDLEDRRIAEARDRDRRRQAGFHGRFGEIQANQAAAAAARVSA
ncbi:MAG: hypothetical protein AB7O91_03940 [Sphingomonas sp.]